MTRQRCKSIFCPCLRVVSPRLAPHGEFPHIVSEQKRYFLAVRRDKGASVVWIRFRSSPKLYFVACFKKNGQRQNAVCRLLGNDIIAPDPNEILLPVFRHYRKDSVCDFRFTRVPSNAHEANSSAGASCSL